MTPKRKLLKILIYLDRELKATCLHDSRFYGLQEALWHVNRAREKQDEVQTA